jgi:predicted RNase H-like HicB family nuclease
MSGTGTASAASPAGVRRAIGTIFPAGLEEGADGSFLVHALTLPGCTAGGSTRDEALSSFQAVLSQWLTLLGSLGETLPPRDAELQITVDEWHRGDAAVADGESSVLLDADRQELTEGELLSLLHRLGDLRGNLLSRVRPLPDAALDSVWRGEWTARLALEELARSHWFTLSRLGSSSMAEVPDRTLPRLDTSMALVVQRFTELRPEARSSVTELEGELWTPRKVLRRLLWLEWTFGRIAIAALNNAGKP